MNSPLRQFSSSWPRTGVQLEASICRVVIGMRYADMKPAMEESWGMRP